MGAFDNLYKKPAIESANGMMARKAVEDLMMLCKGKDCFPKDMFCDLYESKEDFAGIIIQLFSFAAKANDIAELPETISRMITESESSK